MWCCMPRGELAWGGCCPRCSLTPLLLSSYPPTPTQEFGWPSPCGSMYSSVRDLGQILSLMFRDDVAAGAQPNQIIDGASVRDTRLIR